MAQKFSKRPRESKPANKTVRSKGPGPAKRNKRSTEFASEPATTSTRPARTAPPGQSAIKSIWPVMLEMPAWDDYALLDMGSGEKLERYGSVVVRRPEPQAMGARHLPEETWANADATFTGDIEEEGAGRWRFKKEMPETWPMRYGPASFLGRFMSFRHVGVFPEQAAHWDWAMEKVRQAKRPIRVLNLFGYTGLASLLSAACGAQVTHVDASKKAIGWARENQALSDLQEKPIRWICEDAAKFTTREIRRQNTYDAVIFDPPKFGRGPNGEVWNLFDDLPDMVDLVRQVLSDNPLFVLLSAYSIRASFLAPHELMREAFHDLPGNLESGELFIREQAGERALSTSMFTRWSAS